MNPRVLELLKNPKNIQSEDLNLLKEEINSFPYIQNIRALHLYGIHLFDKENYQKELSTTAAYTTDKKILYQLINGKIQQKAKPEIVEEEKPEIPKNTFKYIYKKSNFPIKREEIQEEITDKKQEEAFTLQPHTTPEIKHILVNGERNRILFEGEENFLEDDTVDTIDLESTLESGSIVLQKIEKQPEEVVVDKVDPIHEESVSEDIQNEDQVEETAELNPEIIINEEKIDSEVEEEKIDDESDVSFHEIEPVLTEEDQSNTTTAEEFVEAEAKIEFTPEEIINEEKITSESETEKVNNEAELSFHGTDSFLPEVKIQSNTIDETVAEEEIAQPSNKHEDEMRRLIEEVEKKMKATKVISEKKDAEPEVVGHEISFAETQHFNVETKEEKSDSEIEVSKVEENASELIENKSEETETVEEPEQQIQEETPVAEEQTEVKSVWKPMSLESHVPDSMLNKPIEIPQSKTEIVKEEAPKQEEIVPRIEGIIELPKDNVEAVEVIDEPAKEEKIVETEALEENEEEEEAPALNVSFFNSDIISSWAVEANEGKEEKKSKEAIEEVPTEPVDVIPVDSNVPGFINTWQSWLKIDRPLDEAEVEEQEGPEAEEIQEVEQEKIETKNKVIESFIEKNPKISQLKDEVNFVVKEKTDDISHLMTETLATLYFEQKLYTKAIKAFNILITKHPEKKEHFERKIQDIKDVRGKN
ncbi:hypothetical protein [Chryseobacterium polytrichastri]|uniref:Tetratricopeptide repeat-containing protein n=1 Tax=Chryseobacterium polytrichastri TaxID=1302687 RepID=A0A1M7GAS3_9FLAO|nr:hypothetical protein [Chryseobacterium polytrichastri]SHM13037.1 hypothetical protein SAMN05444267_103531 [Chryseobacterium polytrichastri]